MRQPRGFRGVNSEHLRKMLGVRSKICVRKTEDKNTNIGVRCEELDALIKRLKKNRENVSKEDLETKYKKSYNELLEKIRSDAMDILVNVSLSGLELTSEELKEIAPRIQEVIDSEKDGIYKDITKALYRHYDVLEFKDCVHRLKDKIFAVYLDYKKEQGQKELEKDQAALGK